MNSIKVLIFGGTEEGKNIAEFVSSFKVYTILNVVSEYARQLVSENKYLSVNVKRMNEHEMKAFITNQNFTLIVDATHPYAYEVSNIIDKICNELKLKHLRLLREQYSNNYGTTFETVEAVVEYLKEKHGTILLTTGTKDLEKFVTIKEYNKRIYVRTLPMFESLKICNELGFLSKNIICMQGPFSVELNLAILRHINAKFIVTKESGKVGGVDNKIEAAKLLNIKVLVIKRPVELKGFLIQEIKKEIKNYLEAWNEEHE